ncbi:MAG: hypothetical protein AAFR89_06255 [Cyanobacteria bacterium J06633_1]
MFRVITPGFEASYERWTDALNQANSLIPNCKGLFKDIRIYHGENLIWVYSRSHKYPQYIGAGVYDNLARLFIAEAMAEEAANNSDPDSDSDLNTDSQYSDRQFPQLYLGIDQNIKFKDIKNKVSVFAILLHNKRRRYR